MKTFKCGVCKNEIAAKRENKEGIVYFDNKYWHKDCFIQECNKRIANGRSKKHDWKAALNDIDKWQEEASATLKLTAIKDDIYNFIMSHYCISCANNSLFTKLSAVYDGSYHGLAYPISPEELLNEWEYYFPQLVEARKNKNMSDSQAISYDIAILLTKNAEYRALIEKKKVEECAKEAQKSVEIEIDTSAINGHANISRGNRRLANLYEDFMGGGNNG